MARRRDRAATANGAVASEAPGDIEVVGWELVERRPAAAGEWEVALGIVMRAPDRAVPPERVGGIHHPPIDIDPATAVVPGVLWLGGVGGGTTGPAGGMYPILARQLAREGVASLRLDYRDGRDLESCVVDAIIGVGYLRDEGADPIAIVGHSAGGAVAVTVGAMLEGIATVVALATQAYGTDLASELAPASLLLVHGLADGILPAAASRHVESRSGAARTAIHLLPDAGHSFEGREADTRNLVLEWLRAELGPPPSRNGGRS